MRALLAGLALLALVGVGLFNSSAGPYPPPGAHMVDLRSASAQGVPTDVQAIIAAGSLDNARDEVLASRHYGNTCRPVCWSDATSRSGVVYLAVSTLPTCTRKTLDAAAVDGQRLYFVHWIALLGPACGGAGSLRSPFYALYTVARNDLPKGGDIEVRLLIEDSGAGDSVAAQTLISL